MIRTQPTEISFVPIIKKSFSEEKIDQLGSSYRQEMVDMSRKQRKIKETKINVQLSLNLDTKYKFPPKKLSYFFSDYVLPNTFACLFFFMLTYVDYSLPCEKFNIGVILWKNFRIVFFEISFYPFLYYYLFFSLIFGKIKSKQKKKKYKILYCISSLLILTIFQFSVYFEHQANLLIMHPVCLLNAFAFMIIICKKNNINFNESIKVLAVSMLIPVIIFADYYLIKKVIIIRLIKTEFSKNMKFFFKIMIFIYLSGYRNLLKKIIIYHFKFIKKQKLRRENNGVLLFLNFNLSDVMSASLVPVLIYHGDIYSALINIIFFSYQLLVIYMKSDFIINFLKKFLFYVFNIQTKKKNDTLEEQTRHLMIISLNEILVIIYFRIIFINFTKKFMVISDFIPELSDNCLFFNSNMKIYFELLFLIIVINILMYGTIYFSSKIANNSKQKSIKNKKLSFLGSVFRILIKYYNVELFYQFYFYLAFCSGNSQ